jgi:hypothetical protein
MTYFRTLSRFSILTAAFLSSATLQAQQKYPDSSEITAEPLDQPSREKLLSFIQAPKNPGNKESERERAKIKSTICPIRETIAPEKEGSVKAALAITENDLATEIEFSKGPVGKDTEAPGFSVYVHFTRTDVLVRSSLPRFPSDSAGLSGAFPGNGRRLAWIEGKKGSDLLYIIPETRDCNLQAVAICPRVYVPRGTLATTTYRPSAVRFMGSGKGDGLFALGSEQKGKVQASVLATKGISLPEPWFTTDISSTPASTIKFKHIENDIFTPPPFTQGELPFLGAVETRLDFGTESESLRTISRRTTLGVDSFDLPEGERITVRGAQLSIEKGHCYLVSRWQDQIK